MSTEQNTSTPPQATSGAPASTPPATAVPPAPPAQKPDWCPDKFWDAQTGTVDAEGLAKSYTSVERMATRKAEGGRPSMRSDGSTDWDAVAANARGTTEPQDGTSPAPEANSQGNESATPGAPQAVQESLQDVQAHAEKEFNEKGALSADTYARFERVGVTKATVDGVVASRQQAAQAAQQAITADVEARFGGKQQAELIRNWAAINLTPAENAALAQAMTSSPESRAMAVEHVRQRYEVANGTSGNLVMGNRGGYSDGTPAHAAYESWQDCQKDMASPKYATDARFRAEVQNRLAMNLRMGNTLGLIGVVNGVTAFGR